MTYYAYQLYTLDDSVAIGVDKDPVALLARLARDMESQEIEQLQVGTCEANNTDAAINRVRAEDWDHRSSESTGAVPADPDDVARLRNFSAQIGEKAKELRDFLAGTMLTTSPSQNADTLVATIRDLVRLCGLVHPG